MLQKHGEMGLSEQNNNVFLFTYFKWKYVVSQKYGEMGYVKWKYAMLEKQREMGLQVS